MKLITYIGVTSLALALAMPSQAESKRANELERASTFSFATIAGAVAGGPIGMLAGALSGAYIAEKSRKNFEEREQLTMEVNSLESTVIDKEIKVAQLENSLANKLEFQVMFPTGDDKLSFQDEQRLASLAKYLKKNPKLKVRLDGHADPRGTDEYNNVLSKERAESVASALKEKGIEESRISLHSHGASLASTEKNRDKYALDRRVHIEVYDEESSNVAVNQ